MGIRIEYNFNKQKLELWISPQAGKNKDYHWRNFSNRDDYTCLFDKISFPNLNLKDFVKCDYDPFYSKIYFKNQTLHILTLYDKPVIVVWLDKEDFIDFKSAQNDKLLKRNDRTFGIEHVSNDIKFHFVASMKGGKGKFLHQTEIDYWRSTYARAMVSPEQFIVIGGEIEKEHVLEMVEGLSQNKISNLITDNEAKISKALANGVIKVNDNAELQKFIDINRRSVLSGQDHSGAIRAALKYIYYLIWNIDGAATTVLTSQTGWAEPLKKWTDFSISNPAEQKNPPAGKFYGQLINGKITKREEHGIFKAVWSAFSYWTQTGDSTFITGTYLENLEAATNWMERNNWDEKQQAFGYFYTSEDPTYGSNDYGLDAAVGSFGPKNPYTLTFENDTILRIYSYDWNLMAYNSYLMLSAMTKGLKASTYFEKAKKMEPFFDKLSKNKTTPDILYQLKKRGFVQAELKSKHQKWGSSLVYFVYDMPKMDGRGTTKLIDSKKDIDGQFAMTVFSALASMDIEFIDEKEIVNVINLILPENIRSGKYLPMPYAMTEIFGIDDGNTYHDIRPQYFSIGPFLGTIGNLSLKRMPFGIAVRGSNLVNNIENYQFQKSFIDISYTGKGKINEIVLNDEVLQNTLQIPEEKLKTGKNKIQVKLAEKSITAPLLVYSTVRLQKTIVADKNITYYFQTYGKNTLIFKNLINEPKIVDSNNSRIRFQNLKNNGASYLSFEGIGFYQIIVTR